MNPENSQSSPEYLKGFGEILSPDPRNESFVRLDSAGSKPFTLEMHHADIATFVLSASVPEQIKIQFETVKNLYLYAWFVYRFYPVSQQQALTCLELALRERFQAPLPKKYWTNRSRPPTLAPLLKYAIDTQTIRNEHFQRWHAWVNRRAIERYEQSQFERMRRENLEVVELDYNDVVPNEEDRNLDYLSVLKETLPRTRNHYAHGSTSLHCQVLGTIEIVCEILNQLFRKPDENAGD